MSSRIALLLTLVSTSLAAQPDPFPTQPNDTGKSFMVSATNLCDQHRVFNLEARRQCGGCHGGDANGNVSG